MITWCDIQKYLQNQNPKLWKSPKNATDYYILIDPKSLSLESEKNYHIAHVKIINGQKYYITECENNSNIPILCCNQNARLILSIDPIFLGESKADARMAIAYCQNYGFDICGVCVSKLYK